MVTMLTVVDLFTAVPA